MAKKEFFLIVDTETTQDALVADFGAVVVDRKGRIVTQCAVLINGIYTDMQNHPLFFTTDGSIWDKSTIDRRYTKYNKMVESGSRMIASVHAVNRWLEKVKATYNPYLTAYNLPFDLSKCSNTEIDLSLFSKNFCLWSAAYDKWCHTRKYKQFILDNHYFNKPTALQNMTYQTNAEVMARFVTGTNLADEPHTALEDVIFYELPILLKLVRTTKKDRWLHPQPYNWRDCQVKDNFKV